MNLVILVIFVVIVALTIRATLKDDGGTKAVRRLIWCRDDSFSYTPTITQALRYKRITDVGE
jgi:hypothetical protein